MEPEQAERYVQESFGINNPKKIISSVSSFDVEKNQSALGIICMSYTNQTPVFSSVSSFDVEKNQSTLVIICMSYPNQTPVFPLRIFIRRGKKPERTGDNFHELYESNTGFFIRIFIRRGKIPEHAGDNLQELSGKIHRIFFTSIFDQWGKNQTTMNSLRNPFPHTKTQSQKIFFDRIFDRQIKIKKPVIVSEISFPPGKGPESSLHSAPRWV
jgi:hypothetical protein